MMNMTTLSNTDGRTGYHRMAYRGQAAVREASTLAPTPRFVDSITTTMDLPADDPRVQAVIAETTARFLEISTRFDVSLDEDGIADVDAVADADVEAQVALAEIAERVIAEVDQ